MNDIKITFIIPTIGRDSLTTSINSLLMQTCPKWKAIIIFNGTPPTIQSNIDLIKILYIDKTDIHGKSGAGYVRNYGIQFADTEWIAFVDDDDSISEKYVETFLNEIENYPTNDLILFRMCIIKDYCIGVKEYRQLNNDFFMNIVDFKKLNDLDDDTILTIKSSMLLPYNNSTELVKSEVGISFAVKKHIFDSGIMFKTDQYEDFEFLENVKTNKFKMMISPYTLYYVKNNNNNEHASLLYNRVFFNH